VREDGPGPGLPPAGRANKGTSLPEVSGADYRLRYEYSDLHSEEGEEPLEMDWRLSEAQLFFLATGVILPHDRAPSDKLVEWFTRQVSE